MLKESTLLLFCLTLIIRISSNGITVQCGYGEYRWQYDNSIKCIPCKSCLDPRQVKLKNCTATSNTECQCKAGFYWASDTWMPERYCIEHSKCRAGEGLVEKGTLFEDTKCEPCREGVSYSDNWSFDSCKTCTVCSTTVIYKCTATQDTVCSDLGSGDGAIIGIFCFLIAAVFGPVIFIILNRRNKTLNSDIESDNVELSNTNADGGNDISKAQSDAIKTETPGYTKSVNKSYHSDESEEGLVTSYTNSQQSQEQFENDIFDSQSCTESKSQRESENNVIEDEQEAKCYLSPQTTVVNYNDPNTHPGVSRIQADSTESSNENMKKEDANEQKQFPDKPDKPKQSDYEMKNTDTMQSCNKSDLPTDTVRNVDTALKGKITAGNENIKDDQLKINYSVDTDVSINAAAVSPRDSRCCDPDREGVTEESMIEETRSGIRSLIECNFEYEISEKTFWSVDSNCTGRMWFETMAFISRNLKWDEFQSFIMQLVANTNAELLKTINVVINHAREEEKSIKSIIYKVMETWRQATPEATVHCVYDALNECLLKLQCEELKKTLVQKGLVDRMNYSLQYTAGQHEETAQKRYLSPGECSAQNHPEINHEMNELKEEN